MSTRPLLEEERVLLKNKLRDNLQRKLDLELKIGKQFEQLKRTEALMEKGSRMAGAEKE